MAACVVCDLPWNSVTQYVVHTEALYSLLYRGMTRDGALSVVLPCEGPLRAYYPNDKDVKRMPVEWYEEVVFQSVPSLIANMVRTCARGLASGSISSADLQSARSSREKRGTRAKKEAGAKRSRGGKE